MLHQNACLWKECEPAGEDRGMVVGAEDPSWIADGDHAYAAVLLAEDRVAPGRE